MTTDKFEIRLRDGSGELLTTLAASCVEDAAYRFAKSHNQGAMRVTGDTGKGGIFQRGGSIGNGTNWRPSGSPYHVRRAP
jgi:hypothetical protein